LIVLALVYSVGLLVGLGSGPGLVSLIITSATGIALYRSCRGASELASFFSSALAWGFLAYSLLGLLSIAPFYLPGAILLIAAVLLAPGTHSHRVRST
jgi:hypothetical protein